MWYPGQKIVRKGKKNVKEVIFPEGKSNALVLWKIKELRRTTHKTGTLIPVPLEIANPGLIK